MFKILLILGILLLLGIFYMIFRISTLVSVAKEGGEEKRVDGSNKWNALLMMVFLIGTGVLFFWYSYTRFDLYNLPLASKHGAVTDNLFWVTMAVTGVVFIITNVLLFWFSYRYQHKEGQRALFYPDNMRIEVIWTIVPAIVLSVLVFTGLTAWSDITSPAPEDAEVVEIMGYQFAWATRYPGADKSLGTYDFRLTTADNIFGMDLEDENSYDDFSPREIHIPKGKTIHLKIRARDVLHSVYMPHFRLKMDAVPGMPTTFKFVATKTTAEMRAELNNPDFNYELACTEVCGRGHFSMRLLVVVDELEDYEKWKKEQPTWLSLNESYLEKVPENLREVARMKAGIEIAEEEVAEAEIEEEKLEASL
jgi:cytochrome c oxidase subunit II